MKISQLLETLRSAGKKALIPYITAGYPDLPGTMEQIRILEDCGADMIEIGYPFSDPVADGKMIQFSSQEALKQGISMKNFLKMISAVPHKVPLILMSYLNPLLARGSNIFIDLKQAGFSGIVIPDLPVEEASFWSSEAEKGGLELILFTSPVSDEERIRKTAELSKGFLYCINFTGVTGERTGISSSFPSFISQIRKHTTLPLISGFGISEPCHAEAAARYADGVIIGSRIIRAVRDSENMSDVICDFLSALRR